MSDLHPITCTALLEEADRTPAPADAIDSITRRIGELNAYGETLDDTDEWLENSGKVTVLIRMINEILDVTR